MPGERFAAQAGWRESRYSICAWPGGADKPIIANLYAGTMGVCTREEYHLPEKYVICVGSIEERKNQIGVVKAMAELPDDIHLVIVGKNHGNYQPSLMSAIKSLHLTDRVHIISKADFEDFPALYACAQASVYMSLFEGFGIPILESLCCDTPVVTSNVSSMPEAGGEAALYADPKNPSEIARQLKSIIDNPALRQQLVQKGREQREKFTQHRIISELYAMYRELVPLEPEE